MISSKKQIWNNLDAGSEDKIRFMKLLGVKNVKIIIYNELFIKNPTAPKELIIKSANNNHI